MALLRANTDAPACCVCVRGSERAFMLRACHSVRVCCTTLLRSLHHRNKHTQAVPTELPSVHHRGADRWYDNTWRVARTARAVSLLQNRGIRILTRMSLPIGRYTFAPDAMPMAMLFLPVAVSTMRFKRSPPPETTDDKRPRESRKFIINLRKY